MKHEYNLTAFESFLQARGQKSTPIRRQLLALAESLKGFYSLEDIYNLARQSNINHKRLTLLRNIGLMIDSGFIREFRDADGILRYETRRHVARQYLFCVVCGKCESVNDDAIEQEQERLAAEEEFEPISHAVSVKGYCRKCRRKAFTGACGA